MASSDIETNDFTEIDRYLDDHLDQSIEELKTLVAQPSVAAQDLGLNDCAALVSGMLAARGFRVEIIGTEGAPVVFAERPGRADKTLLFYNHYDVQPAEPLDLWDSPPFEPTLRDGKLYGRGVSDDKGHITARLLAIDALLEADGELPCRIKFAIEGEEEVASRNLHAFVKSHTDKLAADVCVWEFGRVADDGVPEQFLGLRGICYVELSVETATIDAHSGIAGSIFPNAAWRLVWALSTLKGPDERIRIPGHYDAVKPPSARDLEYLAALPDTAATYRRDYGVTCFLKDTRGGAELNRQEVFEPTCTICGLTSGYQAQGSKTVLPARASAKVDFRLVPDQTPQQVLKHLRAHLDAEGFADVKIDFLGGEPASRTDPDHPFVQLVTEAARPVYGHPMRIHPMIGGSGPSHMFAEHLDVPIVCAGMGYSGTQAHAPNENVRLDHYLQHARHMARVLKGYAQS